MTFEEALDVIREILSGGGVVGPAGGIIVTRRAVNPSQTDLPMGVLRDLGQALTQSTTATADQRISGLSALVNFMTTWQAVGNQITYVMTDLRYLSNSLEPLRGQV